VSRCLDGLKSDCGTNPVAVSNLPPTVDAGTDGTVVLPNALALGGAVVDDDLPSGTLTSLWSVLSGPGEVAFADATAPATAATFSAAGAYVLRLTADDGALTSADDVVVTVTSAGATVVLDVAVSQRSDDAEEVVSTGAVSLSSSDLELTNDSGIQVVGIRFSGLPIPAGSQITAAWVQFETDELKSVDTSLAVQAQAADDAPSFATTAFNISSRPRTAGSVPWAPPAWTIRQERGLGQRTPDLAGLVQTVVARPGWAGGHAVVIVITGTGVRTAEAFDGTAPPVLHVEFVPPAA
jgi:hypothetical protein